MKIRVFVLISALMTLLFFAPEMRGQGNGPTSPYFPLHLDNTWNYAVNDTVIVRTDKIVDTVSIGGELYYVYVRSWNGLYPMADTIRADSIGRVWLYDAGGDRLWFDFTLGDGATYAFQDPSWLDTFTVTVHGNPVFGCEFDSCLSLSFDDPHVVDEEVTKIFTRDIGPVGELGAWVWYSFHSAVIDGRVITGVGGEETVPSGFFLRQNFPNPFNPSTNISFSLPSSGPVTLKIFDILGRELATLVDERMGPGIRTVVWDAGTLPGGIYFCRMTAGDFRRTMKMALVP